MDEDVKTDGRERTEEEKAKILEDFAAKISDQRPLEPQFAEVLNRCFWELL